jgi:hypothetical protein
MLLTVILLALAMTLVAANPANAYLDPGTGSYFLQLAAASILGILLSARLFWSKIKSVLRNLFRHKPDDANT